MRLTSIRLPNGEKLSGYDTIILNVGVGVVPIFDVEAQDSALDKDDAQIGPKIHMRLRFDYFKGRYQATFVGLEQNGITSTDLREIRVAELLRLASSAGIYVIADKDELPVSILEWLGEDMYIAEGSPFGQMIKDKGPEGWVLRWVSLIYSVAHISSQPPAKAVEKAFGLPARTAARWIAKAKESGDLKRPAVPGYETATELNDSILDKLDKGEGLVHEVTVQSLNKLLNSDSKDGDNV